MSVDSFLLLLVLNPLLYLLALLLSVLTLIPVFRRYTLGWFDPLSIGIIFAMLANTVPVFLLFTGYIAPLDFLYFVLSESLFWIGIIQFAKRRTNLSGLYQLQYDRKLGYLLYLIFLILYFGITLFNYAMVGIPVLSDTSHVSVYENSGGLGVLVRFNNFLGIYVLVYSFYLLHYRRHRSIALTVVILCAAILVGTAAKSAFLNVIFAFWGFYLFYLHRIPKSRRLIPYLLFGAIAAIFIIIMQTSSKGGNLITGITAFFVRLAANGDIYFYAYPDRTFTVADSSQPLTALFSGLLKPMRIIDANGTPSIGSQLAWFVMPSSVGENIGPNARMPISSYLLFGWGGLLLSYLGGLVTSFLMFRLPQYLPKGIIFTAFMTYVYITTAQNITDFIMGIGYWFDFVLNLSLLLCLLFLLTRRLNQLKSLSCHHETYS